MPAEPAPAGALAPSGDGTRLEEDYRLGAILDLSHLQAMADHLYAAGGIPVGILSPEGEILVGAGWQDICVKFHRAHPEAAKRCQESDGYIASRLGSGEYVAYKCRNSLWDIALPLRIEGRHLATLFVGQFFYEGETPDRELFRRQAEEFGFDWPAYSRALDAVPRFSEERVRHMMEYYRNLVAELANAGLALLKLRRAESRLEASLREKDVLLKEIHHRVKNNLNVIVSLLGLQMAGETDRRLVEGLGRSQGRVYAISLIYELLYKQDDLSRVELGAYLRSLVRHLHGLHARPGLLIRESLSLPEAYLDVNRAASCGIVAGEFLTNAYKHAFEGRSEGSIEVAARARDGRLELLVRDDGVGASAEAVSGSAFGLSLARSIAERQLGGDFSVAAEGGTACRISFPLAPGEGARP